MNYFKWDAAVRDYELDAQGIVNNATYINYFEQCRNNFGRALEIDFLELHKAGFDLVVAALEVKYIRPLKASDAFYVTAKISNHDETRLYFEQEIRLKNNDKLAATAIVHVACIDHSIGKSRFPEMLREKLVKILAQ